MPIEYGITVPSVALHPDQGRAFVKLLTGPEGTAVLRAEGFTPISPPAVTGSVPTDASRSLNHPLFSAAVSSGGPFPDSAEYTEAIKGFCKAKGSESIYYI